MAWSIINDSYLTDLPLTCAPHTIALMAIFLAVAFQPASKSISAGSGLPTFQVPSTPNPAVNAASSASFQGLGGRQGMSATINNTMTSPASNRLGVNTSIDGKAKTGARPTPSEKMQRTIRFLAQASVELEQIINAAQEIVSLYEVWESYSEKAVKEALARAIRGRGLDK